ncbi:MAG: hypothetical protein K8L99_15340, partial [Anaerolineae bacterium]|nr:hypothetical protein [Anaerolineae bacterium]
IGASLYVPHLPLYVGGAPAYSPQGCSDSHVQIVSPVSGQRIQGLFRLFGTADGTSFSAYQIEVRPDFASSYDLYAEFNEPVRNGDLGEVDTRAYGRGLHWVRVRVTTQHGSNPVPCAIPVIFD